MKKSYSNFKMACCGLGVMLLPLSACAQEKAPTAATRTDLEPFSIHFDTKGNIVMLDEEGNAIPQKEVSFPIKTTAIEGMDALSVVKYHGSHVYVIRTASGAVYHIPGKH